MSNRALILWACFGTLLVTAGTVTTDLPSPTDSRPGSESADVTSPEDPEFQLMSAAYGPSMAPVDQPRLTRGTLHESTVWLARAIYSETKLPHEQELVAWVVRNRVETNYRGRGSYREVVLDPYQFSAFNPEAQKREFLLRLTPDFQLPAWQQALWIAHYVQHADPAFRPFSVETRHFYSERSMTGRQHPYWVNGSQFVSPGWDYQVNDRRFRFYKEIS